MISAIVLIKIKQFCAMIIKVEAAAVQQFKDGGSET